MRQIFDSNGKLTNRRNATWWWYRRRNCLALGPNGACPTPPATVLLAALSPPAFVRPRFPAPTPTSRRAPPPAPLLARQSALLLGCVVALAADARFVAPITAGSSLPSSRFRVIVIPRQNGGAASAEATPLQRTRASLCTWYAGIPAHGGSGEVFCRGRKSLCSYCCGLFERHRPLSAG